MPPSTTRTCFGQSATLAHRRGHSASHRMASLYGLNAQTAITKLTIVLVRRQERSDDPGI